MTAVAIHPSVANAGVGANFPIVFGSVAMRIVMIMIGTAATPLTTAASTSARIGETPT